MVGVAQAFRHFVETQFQFSGWAARQRDGARRHPQVTAAFIFCALVYQAVLGLDSLLALDQWLRSPLAPKLLAPTGRRRGSDSTLLRSLSAWKLALTRQVSYAVHGRLRARGWTHRVLCTGRKVTLAVVDGSCFGGMWAAALGVAGAQWQTLDLQRYAKRGKELPAARQLMARATQRLGKGFATHLLYDGLMAVRDDFMRALRQWGMHLVVKTTEQTLEIVGSTRTAWSAWSEAAWRAAGVQVVRGVDAERLCAYDVWAQGDLHWEGLAWPLKVARVRETPLKGKRAGQTEEFWVISTDESLAAEELRELAHARWTIENNGFKTISAAVGSKRAYLKNEHSREALLLIWSIGLALAAAFELWLGRQRDWPGWGAKKTRRLLGRWIEWTATQDEVPACGGSP